jgi:hypothetical protein
MKRTTSDPDTDSFDIASLRASLMGEKTHDGRNGSANGRSPGDGSMEPPTAEEVLRSSPNVVRLCESYHQNRARSHRRGRTQLIGLGGMVTAILLAVFLLFHQGRVGSDLVYQIGVAMAGASLVALTLLLALRYRDQRRLRELQGDRLVRAVRLKCMLPPERVEAYVGQRQHAQRFFQCYELWRKDGAPEAITSNSVAAPR